MYTASLSVHPPTGNVVLQDFCHLAVTSCVLLPLESGLYSVLAMNPLMGGDQSMVGSLGEFASISRGQRRSRMRLRSSRIGSSSMQPCIVWVPEAANLDAVLPATHQGNVGWNRAGPVGKLFLASQHSGCRRSF